MPVTIAAAATAQHAAAVAAAPTNQPTAQQLAGLKRMLGTYSRDQSRGADAQVLSALGKQIMVTAKALGQHVTLPHGGATATPAAATASRKGAVNVKA